MAEQPAELTASITIDATPAQVWSVLSDVTRMPEFSPELQKVIRLGAAKDGIRQGTRFIGLNRRQWLWWPTTSKVVRFEPEREIAWKTQESGATWSYRLAPTSGGTEVTSRRELPAYTIGSKLMTPLMGGAANHDTELGEGMRVTLERIRTVIEGPAGK
ncbi:SRPBCC family protein [Skermania sp. ID1734]|uniref:SRPBCC family protein n=1 Tax=Skermania sp. ID1734 TaxID=2597516 RepID=UPI001180CC00|nr:SRPBCC family protein [Skermania sp. ID1734]TSE00350.1 SRPBCC family protein [Skermania sp. ID1734]